MWYIWFCGGGSQGSAPRLEVSVRSYLLSLWWSLLQLVCVWVIVSLRCYWSNKERIPLSVGNTCNCFLLLNSNVLTKLNLLTGVSFTFNAANIENKYYMQVINLCVVIKIIKWNHVASQIVKLGLFSSFCPIKIIFT